MEGIRYLTDESGKRVAVQLDLETYGELWEDIEDTLVARSREGEESVPAEEVFADIFEDKKLSA